MWFLRSVAEGVCGVFLRVSAECFLVFLRSDFLVFLSVAECS